MINQKTGNSNKVTHHPLQIMQFLQNVAGNKADQAAKQVVENRVIHQKARKAELINAIKENDLNAVLTALEKGAPVNIKIETEDKRELSITEFAEEEGFTNIIKAFSDDADLENLNLLRLRAADKLNNSEKVELIQAYLSFDKLMIKVKADPLYVFKEQKFFNGATIAHLAAALGRIEDLNHILESDKVFINSIKDFDSQNLLHYAQNEKTISYLLALGINPLLEDRDGLNNLDKLSAEQLEILKSQGLNTSSNLVTEDSSDSKIDPIYTALIAAIEKDDLKALQAELKKEPDFIHYENKNSEKLLHLAAKYNSQDILEYLVNKIGINTRNSAKETPLIVAIKNRSYESAELLLKKQPDLAKADLERAYTAALNDNNKDFIGKLIQRNQDQEFDLSWDRLKGIYNAEALKKHLKTSEDIKLLFVNDEALWTKLSKKDILGIFKKVKFRDCQLKDPEKIPQNLKAGNSIKNPYDKFLELCNKYEMEECMDDAIERGEFLKFDSIKVTGNWDKYYKYQLTNLPLNYYRNIEPNLNPHSINKIALYMKSLRERNSSINFYDLDIMNNLKRLMPLYINNKMIGFIKSSSEVNLDELLKAQNLSTILYLSENIKKEQAQEAYKLAQIYNDHELKKALEKSYPDLKQSEIKTQSDIKLHYDQEKYRAKPGNQSGSVSLSKTGSNRNIKLSPLLFSKIHPRHLINMTGNNPYIDEADPEIMELYNKHFILSAIKHNKVNEISQMLREGIELNIFNEENRKLLRDYLDSKEVSFNPENRSSMYLKDDLEFMAAYLSLLERLDNLETDQHSLHQKYQNKSTLLHIASALGQVSIVKQLLAKGLRLDLKDTNGLSPLDYAIANGSSETIKLLQEEEKLPHSLADIDINRFLMAYSSEIEEIKTSMKEAFTQDSLGSREDGTNLKIEEPSSINESPIPEESIKQAAQIMQQIANKQNNLEQLFKKLSIQESKKPKATEKESKTISSLKEEIEILKNELIKLQKGYDALQAKYKDINKSLSQRNIDFSKIQEGSEKVTAEILEQLAQSGLIDSEKLKELKDTGKLPELNRFITNFAVHATLENPVIIQQGKKKIISTRNLLLMFALIGFCFDQFCPERYKSAIGESIIDNSQYLYDKIMKIFKSEVKKQKTKQIKKSSRLEPKELKYKSYAARVNGNNSFGSKEMLAKAVKFRRKG